MAKRVDHTGVDHTGVDHTGLSRRGLLRGATVAGAAAVGSPLDAKAQAPAQPRPPGPITPAPNPAMESGHPREAPIVQGTCGSDYMADVIRSLGIEHVACNPGTSFRGLQELLVNYLKIDWHTCTHEETSVAMANGYAKIEGKPLLTLAHGTVGLQHASMALYNAWCDRAPVYMMVGNTVDAAKRAPGGEWAHSVQDAAATVRDFVKWDDLPGSLKHFGRVRGARLQDHDDPADGPVVLVARQRDAGGPDPRAREALDPQVAEDRAVVGDSGAVAETARGWSCRPIPSSSPTAVPARRRHRSTSSSSPRCCNARWSTPAAGSTCRPPSAQPVDRARGNVAQADCILGLEMRISGARSTPSRTTSTARRATSPTRGQDRQHRLERPLHPLELPGLPALHRHRSRHPADAEETMPDLIEAVKLVNGEQKAALRRAARSSPPPIRPIANARDTTRLTAGTRARSRRPVVCGALTPR